MEDLVLVQMDPVKLLIVLVISMIMASVLARKTQGNIGKRDLIILFVVSTFFGIVMSVPVFIALGLGLFSIVVYSFKVSKY